MYRLAACLIGITGAIMLWPDDLRAELQVRPVRVVLDRPEASQQILVTETLSDRRRVDRTRDVSFKIQNPDVVEINDRGLLQPLNEGGTDVLIRVQGEELRISIEVRGLTHPLPISFPHEIIPILSKTGCNSGGCHGKAEGQNGFKLSVFGFDPRADYEAISNEARQRRLFPPSAPQSLLLTKATAQVPHGGGRRIQAGSLPYRRLQRWIAEGARFTADAHPVVRIEVEPAEVVLLSRERQQLRVTAIDTEGNRRCITTEAEYESNEKLIAEPDENGLIQAGLVPGEAAILVRYMGQVAVSRVTSPRPGVKFTRPPEANFIDTQVWNKLAKLGIAPSPQCNDATFLRRVYLDTIGTLPTVLEARRFLDDQDKQKRRKLIDELLNRDEYADYWAMRWSDVLRVDRDKLKPQGAVAMTRWLHQQFAENRPYDEFARDIVTAKGDLLAVGPASLYMVLDSPEILSRSISQLMLGVRIECAQCHHHPFEKWGQDDYFALAGFFTGVTKKSLPNGNLALVARGGNDLKHPRSGEMVATRALGASAVDLSAFGDRREALADWMVAEDNPFFARAIANRLWAHYFGRGLVEPIDDLRETNPATNEPLLAALETHLREVNFDLKQFTRTLLNSQVYQRSSETNSSNASDAQNYSHAHPKPLEAEVLLDAISQSTGVAEKYDGWPLGYRAIQIWDNRLPSYFFTIFGRPVRDSVCECERSNEPSIAQALHLMNSPEITAKIEAPTGRAAKLAANNFSPEATIEELFLACLSRLPSSAEQRLFLQEFQHSPPLAATEDVLWTLLNSKEFLYNH